MNDEEKIHEQCSKEMLVAQANLLAQGLLQTHDSQFVKLTEKGTMAACIIFAKLSAEDQTLVYHLITETEV
jgi:Mn-dependent DtxR family transcriptional regulator